MNKKTIFLLLILLTTHLSAFQPESPISSDSQQDSLSSDLATKSDELEDMLGMGSVFLNKRVAAPSLSFITVYYGTLNGQPIKATLFPGNTWAIFLIDT